MSLSRSGTRVSSPNTRTSAVAAAMYLRRRCASYACHHATAASASGRISIRVEASSTGASRTAMLLHSGGAASGRPVRACSGASCSGCQPWIGTGDGSRSTCQTSTSTGVICSFCHCLARRANARRRYSSAAPRRRNHLLSNSNLAQWAATSVSTSG
jgi:hypothetical protein